MPFKNFSRPSKPFQLLYLGYIISCIGDRLWTFAIIFILQRLGGMRLVGINQLFESVSAMLLASYVGNWLDRHDRKNGNLFIIKFLVFFKSFTKKEKNLLHTQKI